MDIKAAEEALKAFLEPAVSNIGVEGMLPKGQQPTPAVEVTLVGMADDFLATWQIDILLPRWRNQQAARHDADGLLTLVHALNDLLRQPSSRWRRVDAGFQSGRRNHIVWRERWQEALPQNNPPIYTRGLSKTGETTVSAGSGSTSVDVSDAVEVGSVMVFQPPNGLPIVAGVTVAMEGTAVHWSHPVSTAIPNGSDVYTSSDLLVPETSPYVMQSSQIEKSSAQALTLEGIWIDDFFAPERNEVTHRFPIMAANAKRATLAYLSEGPFFLIDRRRLQPISRAILSSYAIDHHGVGDGVRDVTLMFTATPVDILGGAL